MPMTGPTHPSSRRSSSSMACGRSPARGTDGPKCSRPPAMLRWRPDGRRSWAAPRRQKPSAGALDRRPALIGHSLGGLIAQTLAGRGLSAATVAIEPAPFRRVLPLPAWTEAPVDAEAAERGPLLMIFGERDRSAPPSVTRAAHERQKRNKHAVTEFVQLPRRGRSLPIDSGWREVAQNALAFVRRFL